MIDLKPPEEEEFVPILSGKEIETKSSISEQLNPDAYYLREISRTLKDILKEMRKRKV